MEPSTIVIMVFFIVFFVVVLLMFVGATRQMTVAVAMQTKLVSTEDFQRLLDKEESPIVFYTKVAFSGYYYFVTVKQDRICTKS